MPLDGHSYLVAQGWSGKGSGLRHGSISKPLAIPQKKTLSGLGKDRDDAFPFWDHVFNVAAKTIQVKIHKDEDDSSNSDPDIPDQLPALIRTSTGLISNKRPMFSTSVSLSSSGSSTPSSSEASSSNSRMSIVAIAKRDAARRGLYSRFFRGPVLGPDTLNEEVETTVASSSGLMPSTINSSGSTSPLVMSGEMEKRKAELILGDKVKKEKGGKKEKKEKKKAKKKHSVNEVDDKAARKLMRKEKRKEKKRKEKGKDIEESDAEPHSSLDAQHEHKRKRKHSNDDGMKGEDEKKLKRRKRERVEKNKENNLAETQKEEKRRTKKKRIGEPGSRSTPEQEEKRRRKAKKKVEGERRKKTESNSDS
ncbi:ribosome biogenesis [Pyrrhoderma noxium]|uniref:Ribosome biogenesis n=1 Tax=Pyrrhoderma noxium TaxID=2282107 RepID=A0A286UBR4_9AGAM|nr:ribosome biogenesis [Pyrrhoderma noxium]